MDLSLDNGIRKQVKALGIVVLIPTYNNEKTLLQVVDSVLCYSEDILVVNDGSTDSTAGLLASRPEIQTLQYEKNRGKGYAIKLGLRHAASLGYRYAITIDSDGQHFADDIPTFVAELQENPGSLLIGARNLQAENMPGRNTFANKFSNFWFRVETGIRLDDTQSGFRAYPLDKIPQMRFVTRRYEFEVEVIVRAAWKGIRVANVPVKVYYPPEKERVSHFVPARDFTRISILNTFLVLIALLVYYPWRFLQYLSWNNIKKYFTEDAIPETTSNFVLACSAALGVCCGILPIWGYQLVAAWGLAKLLDINRLVAVIGSNVSLPPFIPFILYGSYRVGCRLMGHEMAFSFDQISLSSLASFGLDYIVGSLVLSLVAGLTTGLLVWLILSVFRKRK